MSENAYIPVLHISVDEKLEKSSRKTSLFVKKPNNIGFY